MRTKALFAYQSCNKANACIAKKGSFFAQGFLFCTTSLCKNEIFASNCFVRKPKRSFGTHCIAKKSFFFAQGFLFCTRVPFLHNEVMQKFHFCKQLLWFNLFAMRTKSEAFVSCALSAHHLRTKAKLWFALLNFVMQKQDFCKQLLWFHFVMQKLSFCVPKAKLLVCEQSFVIARSFVY